MVTLTRVVCFRQNLFTRYLSYFSNYDISDRLVARLGELKVRKLTDIQEKARELVARALEYFTTAPSYNPFTRQALIAQAVYDYTFYAQTSCKIQVVVCSLNCLASPNCLSNNCPLKYYACNTHYSPQNGYVYV